MTPGLAEMLLADLVETDGPGLHSREVKFLAKAGITTLGELASTSVENLIRVENLGIKRIPVLIQLVAMHLN